MCDKEKVTCPWCGSEMTLHGWPKMNQYVCEACGAKAPIATGDDNPYDVAMKRVEQKPLNPLDLHDGDIVWIENRGCSIPRPVQVVRTNPAYCIFYKIGSDSECGSGMGSYGTTWRCWGIAPNKYEMEESPWYDDD